LYNIPYDFVTYAEVVVRDNIAESCDLSPFDVRIFFFYLIREVFDGFTDDLQVS